MGMSRLLRTSPELVVILLAKEPKPLLIIFFVMIPVKYVKVGVIPFGLSNHYLIFCSRKGFKYTFSTHNTADIRSMKNYVSWRHSAAWSEFRSILMVLLIVWHQEKLLGLSSVLNLGCPPLLLTRSE